MAARGEGRRPGEPARGSGRTVPHDASAAEWPVWLVQSQRDVLVRVKAVPGASRSQIAGVLGDRLKVRVSAPPEGGRANAAIAALLAQACGVPSHSVVLHHGPSQALKVFRLVNAGPAECRALIARAGV